MRVIFQSEALPKKAAKRIMASGFSQKISDAQEITAKLFGFTDWHELNQTSKRHTGQYDPVDEMLPVDMQQKRLDFQISKLKELFHFAEDESRHYVQMWRVTASNPDSDKLGGVGVALNKLEWGMVDGVGGVWYFRPSSRSFKTFDDICELVLIEPQKPIKLKDHLDKFIQYITRQPENIYAIYFLLSEAISQNAEVLISGHIRNIEESLMACLPIAEEDRLALTMQKYCPNNRMYVDSLFWLGYCFYRDSDWKTSERLFSFVASKGHDSKEKALEFLADLARDKPRGYVTLDSAQLERTAVYLD